MLARVNRMPDDADDRMIIPTTPKKPTPSDVGQAYCGEVKLGAVRREGCNIRWYAIQ